MQKLIHHFNKKKQGFNHFFLQIMKILEQINYNTQLQIDKQYDIIVSQFSNSSQQKINIACQQMQKHREKTFQTLIDIICSHLKTFIQEKNIQDDIKVQIQKKQIKNNHSFQTKGLQNLNVNSQNFLKDQTTFRTDLIQKNSQKIVQNHRRSSSKNIKNLIINEKISKSPPKIVFKNNPINSYQFNYSNPNFIQSNVRQFNTIPNQQRKRYVSGHFQSLRNYQKESQQSTHISGKICKNQQVSQFHEFYSLKKSQENQKQQKQKSKRKISVTKNHQICQNLDKQILLQASQLLQKSQSRKKMHSLKKSNVSQKKSPEKQSKFISLVNKTITIDKIIESRIGENNLNNSKKIIGSLDEFTSPVKKYNL